MNKQTKCSWCDGEIQGEIYPIEKLCKDNNYISATKGSGFTHFHKVCWKEMRTKEREES